MDKIIDMIERRTAFNTVQGIIKYKEKNQVNEDYILKNYSQNPDRKYD